jgi:hypothetical protein
VSTPVKHGGATTGEGEPRYTSREGAKVAAERRQSRLGAAHLRGQRTIGLASTPGRLYEEISSHRFDLRGKCACGYHLNAMNPVEQARHLTEAILAAGFIHESDAGAVGDGETYLVEPLARSGVPKFDIPEATK